MVMKPDPIFRAVETVLTRDAGWTLPAADAYVNLPAWDPENPPQMPANTPIILLAPTGQVLTQSLVIELASHDRLAMICGRYEGVDARVRSQLVTQEISIGDYVISGGELAAMVIVDAVTRLQTGALGYQLGAQQDSHSPGLDGLLEGPQYTKPLRFRGESAPDILLSGHHSNLARWRREQALLRTLQQRPEILARSETAEKLSSADLKFLRAQGWSG